MNRQIWTTEREKLPPKGSAGAQRWATGLRWKLLTPVVVTGAFVCVFSHWMIVRSATSQVERLSVRDAEAMSLYVRELRRYYTANVVARAKASGVMASHDFAAHPGAIPLPATLVHDLNRATSRSEQQPSARLFSPYPFPWRHDGGAHGSYDEQDWQTLSRNPKQAVVRTLTEGEQPVVRYATADVMSVPACVGCHNTHVSSPKKDWQLGQTRGVLVVTVPMGAALTGARADAMRATALVIAITFVLLLTVLWIMRRQLFVPLAELKSAAQRIATGDLSVQVQHRSADELGELADSFRLAGSYLGTVSTAIAQLGSGDAGASLIPASEHDIVSRKLNTTKHELERRATRLLARNAEMRLVLDNVKEGLMTVAVDGTVYPECSAALLRWFGVPRENVKLWEYLAPTDTAFREWFAASWESLGDGFLPLPLLMDQLPKRFATRGIDFTFEYQPIVAASEELLRVLVVVSDVSRLIAAQRAEAEQREALGLVQRLLADRSGTIEFFHEVEEIVSRIQAEPDMSRPELARLLHTLKGNCAIFGVERLSAFCHELEDRLERDGVLSAGDRSQLTESWTRFSRQVGALLGGETTKSNIVVDEFEYDRYLEQLVQGSPRSELAKEITRWRYDRVQPRLERLAEQAKRIANNVGKPIDVEIEATGMRVRADRLRKLWLALVHPLRNAIDHGLENAEERARVGKPARGKLVLRIAQDADTLLIELTDDGRGIDWAQVQARAEQRGIHARTHEQLVAALFAGGVSTKQSAGELSGRGVGMSAIHSAVEELGGKLDVESHAGTGTTIRISLPDIINRTSLRVKPGLDSLRAH